MAPRFHLVPTQTRDSVAIDPARDVADLVLRVVRRRAAPALAESPDGVLSADAFLVRRARHAVRGVRDGTGRRLLSRILDSHLQPGAGPDARACALLGWAGHLESRGRLTEAARVLELATERRPNDPGLALHAARVARKSGNRAGARALYDRVRDLDDGGGDLERMAAVGSALLAADPVRELGRAIRRAVRAGDGEAAAVAQEARARARRRGGDADGAVRDFLVAGARFEDAADVGRIGHALADLFTSTGDLAAARRALLETERRGHPEQAQRARARLFTIARTRGDELGLRRWAEAGPPPLVSLMCGVGGRTDAESREDRLPRFIGWAAGRS